MKYMEIKEFVEKGFLQEVNRQFFHPLGLALAVEVIETVHGTCMLSGIWDCRNDPEGMVFADLNDKENRERADLVEGLRQEKARIRMRNFGWIRQPILFGEEDE